MGGMGGLGGFLSRQDFFQENRYASGRLFFFRPAREATKKKRDDPKPTQNRLFARKNASDFSTLPTLP